MDMKKSRHHCVEKSILAIACVVMMCLCNFCMSKGWYVIGEALIAGVPLSLLLLGYLAGLEKIEKPFCWLSGKALYLVPYLVLVIIMYSAYTVSGKAYVTSTQWLFCIFNIQGLNYTIWKFNGYEAVAGFSHLWILTTIAICYLITPLLQKIKRVNFTSVKRAIVVIGLLLAQLGLLFLGVQLSYIITYVVGYIMATRPIRTDGKWYAFVSIMTAVVTAVRLLARELWDGTIFYNSYVALISSAMIGAWIFYTVFFFGDKLPKIYKALDCRAMEMIAEIFCYVYLIHYLFIKGSFSVGGYIDNKVIEPLLIIVFSVISGAILWFVTEKIIFKTIKTAFRRKNEDFSCCA